MKLKVKRIVWELTNDGRGKLKLQKQVYAEWWSCTKRATDEGMPATSLTIWELGLKGQEHAHQECKKDEKKTINRLRNNLRVLLFF